MNVCKILATKCAPTLLDLTPARVKRDIQKVTIIQHQNNATVSNNHIMDEMDKTMQQSVKIIIYSRSVKIGLLSHLGKGKVVKKN